MSSSYATYHYGSLILRYKCESCGQRNEFKFPRYSQGSAVGYAPDLARERARSAGRLLAIEDMKYAKTLNPKDFFESNVEIYKRCINCRFIQSWQQSRFRKSQIEFLTSLAAICSILFTGATGFVCYYWLALSVENIFIITATTFVIGLILTAIFRVTSVPKIVDKKLQLMITAAGETKRYRLKIVFEPTKLR